MPCRAMARAQSLMRAQFGRCVDSGCDALFAVLTSAISDARDFTLALVCFVALIAWKAPP